MKTVVETIRTHKPDLAFQVLRYRGINVDTIPGRPLGPTIQSLVKPENYLQTMQPNL